jgi:hypothetical protein
VSALIILIIVAIQWAGGVVIWQWITSGYLRARCMLPLGAVVGLLLALLGSQISIAMDRGVWGWFVAPAAALLILLVPRARRRALSGAGACSHEATVRSLSWLTWVPVAVLGLLLQIPNWMRTPIHNGYVVGNSYHPDLVFLEALGQSVSTLGPQDNLLLADAPVRYHWFIYGWSGLVTDLAGVEPFWVLTRVVPIILTVLAAWLAALWARQLSPARWVPSLAALLVVVAGYVGADQGVMLTFDSPSNGLATVVLLAFALTFTLAMRAPRPAPFIILLGFLSFGLAGAKASHAAIACVGVGIAAIALSARSRGLAVRTAWSVTLATGAGALSGYLLLLSGISGSDSQIAIGGDVPHASTYQGLDPSLAEWGFVLGTLVLILAMAPRWIGLLPLLGSSRGRAMPETWLVLGMIIAGALPLLLLTSGINAAWFALGASGPASVMSAVGIGVLAEHVSVRGPRRFIIGAVVVAALAWLMVLVNYGLEQVTGSLVGWRSPVFAWIACAVASLALVPLLRGRLLYRWVFALAVTISVTAIFSRIAGPVLWSSLASSMRPVLEHVVLTTDPDAEFTATGTSATSIHERRGAVPLGASAPAPPRDDDFGVAFADDRVQWSPGLQEAALELRAASGPQDVVAMDYSIIQPFLPITAERRMLLAGQPYVDGYTSSAAASTIPERFARFDEFRMTGSPAAHRWLWDNGVRWVWLQFSPRPDAERLSDMTSPLVLTDEVAVLRLNAPDANSE